MGCGRCLVLRKGNDFCRSRKERHVEQKRVERFRTPWEISFGTICAGTTRMDSVQVLTCRDTGSGSRKVGQHGRLALPRRPTRVWSSLVNLGGRMYMRPSEAATTHSAVFALPNDISPDLADDTVKQIKVLNKQWYLMLICRESTPNIFQESQAKYPTY
jgi:hypothetical protein